MTVESGSNPLQDTDRPFASPSPAEPAPEGRHRILIVEDNKADLYLIRDALEVAQIDADIQVVHDGVSAQRLFEAPDQGPAAPCPDLVLLDLNLPKMNGEAFLQDLRSSSRYRDTQVLVITSSDSRHDRRKVTELGIAGYFRKPSEYAEFLKLGPLVKELLNHKSISGP